MSEYMKCIDPGQRWIWQHPENPAVRFEYKALAGPTLTRDLGARYLNGCITRAWHVSLPGVGNVDEWTIEAGPTVDWAKVLPSPVGNALFLAIAAVSQLTEEEDRDSLPPSGQPSSQKTTTATPAGAPAGSVLDGKTPSKPVGNGSGTKPRPRAGAR